MNIASEAIVRLKEEALARGDAKLAAVCEIARSGKLSQDYLQGLPRTMRAELLDWTREGAQKHIAPLLQLDDTLPLEEPSMNDPAPAPATVNVNRQEQLLDLLETGIIRLQRTPHMAPKQRDRAVARWSRRVARAAFTAEHVHAVGQFLESLFERDPEELRERAALAREEGEIERAQRLEREAGEIEARRGNG